jgi:hypothetical protein
MHPRSVNKGAARQKGKAGVEFSFFQKLRLSAMDIRT